MERGQGGAEDAGTRASASTPVPGVQFRVSGKDRRDTPSSAQDTVEAVRRKWRIPLRKGGAENNDGDGGLDEGEEQAGPSPMQPRQLSDRMGEEAEEDDDEGETLIYPDMADTRALGKKWKGKALIEMLGRVGEKTSGSKEQLLARFVRHATKISLADLPGTDLQKLSVIQVVYLLQQLGLPIAACRSVRLRHLERHVQAVQSSSNEQEPTSDDGQSNDDSVVMGDKDTRKRIASADHSTEGSQSEGDDVEDLEAQDYDSGDDKHAAQKHMRRRQAEPSVSSTTNRLDRKRRKERRAATPEADNANLAELAKQVQTMHVQLQRMQRVAARASLDGVGEAGSARKRRRKSKAAVASSSGSSSSDEDGVRASKSYATKRSKKEDTSELATAILTALETVGGGDGFSGKETAASAGILAIERTHPALVDLTKHKNDAYRFGCLLRRATTIDFTEAEGLGSIAWEGLVEQRANKIHAMIHAGAPVETYHQGKSRFFEHITWLLGLCARHGRDANRYSSQRRSQLSDWPGAWGRYERWLTNATQYLSYGGEAQRLEMETLMATAMSVGQTPSQISKLRSAFKLRSELANAGGQGNDGGRSFRGAYSRWQSRDEGGGSFESGGGLATRPPRRAQATGTGVQSSRDDRKVKRVCGRHMPSSVSILGEGVNGTVTLRLACNSCGGSGHRRYECPVQFYKEHKKCMPGFNANGERVSAAWDGNRITADTKELWARMKAEGYFKIPPVEDDPDSMPDLRP